MYVSAFKDPDRRIVVVAINTTVRPRRLRVIFHGVEPRVLRRYVTSSTDDLAAAPAIRISGGSVGVTLAAGSVTTFIGLPAKR